MAVQANAGQQKKPSGATQFLRDFINETDPTGTPPEVALKNKHARAKAAAKLKELEQKDEAAANRQAAAATRQAEVTQRATSKAAGELADGVAEFAGSVGDAASGVATNTSNWLASLPTPGSIALLLVCILFFVWAVVPVGQNGETRLQLLWLTLMGQTRIAGEGSTDMSKFSPTSQITGQQNTTPSLTVMTNPISSASATPTTQGTMPSGQVTGATLSNALNGSGPVINPNTGYTPNFGIY